MQFVTYSAHGGPAQAGVVIGDRVHFLHHSGFNRVIGVISGGAAPFASIRSYLSVASHSRLHGPRSSATGVSIVTGETSGVAIRARPAQTPIASIQRPVVSRESLQSPPVL